MYIKNSHSFIFPIVPIFITKFPRNYCFYLHSICGISASLTDCSVFIKNGFFKRCHLFPYSFPFSFLSGTQYTSYLEPSFTLLSFNPQFIICSSLNAFMLISSECPLLPAGLFPADFLGPDFTPKLACTFSDFSEHLLTPYQSLSHNKQQLYKWRVRLAQ